MKIGMNKFSCYSEKEKDEMAIQLYKFEWWIKNMFGFLTYLWGGTLLGAVRDKDFISHDNDIDVGFYIGEHDDNTAIEIVKNMHETLGSSIVWASEKKPGAISHFGIVSPNKKFVFDCWSTWSYKNKLYGGVNAEGKYKYPPELDYSILFPLKKIMFRNMNLNIPNNAEKFFDIHYKDWKTPISNKKNGFVEYNT